MPHPFDAAIFIGRFQPPHSGHLAMVQHALDAAKRVIIVLGSAFQSRTPKNPFTWQERRDMLLAALPEADRARVQCIAMRDFYDDARWVQAVRNGVDGLLAQQANADAAARVALVGHFKDASSAYLAQFPNWELLNYPRQGGTDATVVREACFATPQYATTAELDRLQSILLEHVPAAVAQWLLQWRQDPNFVQLQQEWHMLKSYHQSWASAPYPPMFITVDALVQCQGHVLLVERGQMPGKGLYALPGGYLEPRDTLWQSCLRELREETSLDISDDTWRQALRTSRVFDHPDRSLRGRTVTHVFHFDLGYGALPKVLGADDAKAALWVPISELGDMPERFFDDHFFILDGMLQLTHEVPSKVLR
ncbi:NUDIX domain-containing protein [Lampropedia puyangensis]|uniref:NUDIX domain-containing protein n=1 Tax=Lampropedia puyangensis TaxID=1330072 RepID=A0A4S8F066_9BURK|nr:bifunctional nicotinamide-nucleotide adenylyltransferase/Nudix hydroxylase [Lampropedia puyangensis]THT99373.1 NUDIX domain-containing protein [Lampropedia puyangensis]